METGGVFDNTDVVVVRGDAVLDSTVFDNTDVLVGRGDAVLDSTETEMLLATLI